MLNLNMFRWKSAPWAVLVPSSQWFEGEETHTCPAWQAKVPGTTTPMTVQREHKSSEVTKGQIEIQTTSNKSMLCRITGRSLALPNAITLA
jgi:hypothetical protein